MQFVLQKEGLVVCFGLKAAWSRVGNCCRCYVHSVQCTRGWNPCRGNPCAGTVLSRDLVLSHCHVDRHKICQVVFTIVTHHLLHEDLKDQIPPSVAFVHKDSCFLTKHFKSMSIPKITPFSSSDVLCVFFCVMTHSIGHCQIMLS